MDVMDGVDFVDGEKGVKKVLKSRVIFCQPAKNF